MRGRHPLPSMDSPYTNRLPGMPCASCEVDGQPRLPSHCSCGVAFSVNHALSCPKGALPSIRHDRIKDITAQLLIEVCPNVAIEPTLQPLTRERFSLRSTNVENKARLDIKSQEFWNKSRSSTFFDVRLSIPLHPSTTNQQQQLATGSTKWKSGVNT